VFYLKLILVVVIAIVLEGLASKYWEPFRYVDLPLLVTIYFGLMRDPILGMFTGYGAGLGGDVGAASGPVVGVGGFSKTLIGFLIATIAVRFALEGPLVRVLVIGVSSIVNTALFIGLYGVMGQRLTEDMTTESIATRFAFEGAANLIFGVILFWLFDKLFPENVAGGQMRVRRRFYD
jgi:rod shape-determining protein MreD